jgi:hypothetical protein
MPIADYAELQDAVAKWLNRDDLTDRIPDFIRLGEDKINRKLRVQQMLVAVPYTLDSEYRILPEDWLQTANLSYLNREDDAVDYLAPQTFLRARPICSPSGKPRYYTLEAGRKRFLPVPDGAYDALLSYYARLPALATANTNWLLAESADLYLAASLQAACTYLRDIEGAQLAVAEMADIIASMQRSDFSDRVSTTPIARFQPI